MSKTLVSSYESVDAIKNVVDDLINHGIDREHIYIDEESMVVKVMILDQMESGINDILKRHHPVV